MKQPIYMVSCEFGNEKLEDIMLDYIAGKIISCQNEETVVYCVRNKSLCSVNEKENNDD